MYSVSDVYSKAINADTRNVLYRVTLAGAIVADQKRIPKMVITESVGDTSGVAIGTANSSSLTFTLRKADAINYNNILVEPESGLVLPDGSIEWLPLGKFWVTDFRTNNDYETVELSCADGMYHLTGEFESELTYPTDIRNIVNEIVAKTGVTFASSLPSLEVRVKPSKMTFREAIGHLAGCCGCNARFNRLGQLEFFWYEDSGVTIERKTQYLNGMVKLNDKPLEVNFEVVGQKEMYSVTCVAGDNGGITATPGQNVLEGETVVLSINPFFGYELAHISAVTEAGQVVPLLMDSEGGRTFVQPDSNVTVTASFRSSESGAYKLTVRTDENGTIRANKTEYEEGEIATIYTRPYDGYELDRLTTIPLGISLTRRGTNSSGETIYDFVVPKSDVTVTVAYKKADALYSIATSIAEGEGAIYVQEVGTRDFISEATEGTMLGITFSPAVGYVFDHYESSVVLTQIGENSFVFTMPAVDVSFKAYFKLSENESKAGLYSWLQVPQAAPTNKPYWAVFYNESEVLPTCQKFYLVWFDSWEATKYTDEEYTIRFKGYYYCRGKNVGHGKHEWDTSLWSGNGAPSSTLEWDVRTDRLIADWDDYYGPSKQYCLLASNVHLFYKGSLAFERCANAIKSPQTSYLQNGMDIREKGSLARWYCPDTFSSPAPAAHWMVLMPESGLYMTIGEDGKYDTPIGYYPNSLIAFFYDDISIQNLGAIFSDSPEEFYVASFTNARWTYLRDNVLGWDENIYELPEGAVVGFRNPLFSTEATDGYLDGNSYNFAGVLVTSQTLYDTNGNLFMYNNACRICDCASTFSLRKMRSLPNTDPVTIKYENPLVYEKMVDTVSSFVKGITYTPARVKHRGNPAFQVGDIVQAPDKDGVYHTIIILQQTMTFGGGMNSEITSPGQTEQKKSFSANGPISTQIKKEIQQSNLGLERQIAASNALVYAALYKTIGSSEAKINNILEWQTDKSNAMAELELRVGENEAGIVQLAKLNSDTNTSLANLELKVNENKSNIDLVVKNGEVDASVVIEAINGGKSSVKINADNIDISGSSVKINADNLDIGSILRADEFIVDLAKVTGKLAVGSDVGGLIITEEGLKQSIATNSSASIDSEGNAIVIGGSLFSDGTVTVSTDGNKLVFDAPKDLFNGHANEDSLSIYIWSLADVDTVLVSTDRIESRFDVIEDGVSIRGKYIRLTSGGIEVGSHANESLAHGPTTFITVHENSTSKTYHIYVDPETLQVMAREE